MSYLQDRKKRNTKRLRLLVITLVVLFFILIGQFFFTTLSRVSHSVFIPVLSMTNRINHNLSNFSNFFLSKQKLVDENQDLKQKLISIEGRLANYEAIYNENEKLKEILLRKSTNRKSVLALVLGNPNQSPYDTYIIDAGLEQGLNSGDVVFAYGDVPIGTVVEVFADTAKVVLYSRAGEKTNGVLAGTDTFVELIGRGRGNFELILPRDFSLALGTSVLLPGIHPHSLAQVVSIISDPRDAYKKALLKTPVNIFELKFVTIQIK